MDMRRQIASAIKVQLESHLTVNGTVPIIFEKEYLAMADAVLAAMREPSEAMKGAWWVHSGRDIKPRDYTLWQAMIDAASPKQLGAKVDANTSDNRKEMNDE